MSRPRVEVVAAVLQQPDGAVLLAQRPEGKVYAGYWEFPGGKVEAGETFEACLRRELGEELGIEVHVGAEIEDITHSYPEKTVRLRFFLCSLVSGEAIPIHCHALAWVTREQLAEYEFPDADLKLLDMLNRRLEFWRT